MEKYSRPEKHYEPFNIIKIYTVFTQQQDTNSTQVPIDDKPGDTEHIQGYKTSAKISCSKRILWYLQDTPPWSHAGWGSPFPNAKESHVKAKLGGGDSQQLLLPTSSCPHGLDLTPWLLPVHP